MAAFVCIVSLALTDVGWRRAPNWLTAFWLGLAVALAGPGPLVVALLAGAVVWWAGYPAGDVKGAAAMAAWFPVGVVGASVTLAFAASLVIGPRRWPWLPILGAALALVTGLRDTLPVS